MLRTEVWLVINHSMEKYTHLSPPALTVYPSLVARNSAQTLGAGGA